MDEAEASRRLPALQKLRTSLTGASSSKRTDGSVRKLSLANHFKIASLHRKSEPVVGRYLQPIIDEQTPACDPWQRNYYQHPPSLLTQLVPWSFPLTDLRPQLTEYPESCGMAMLQSHGFGVVRHRSTLVSKLSADSDDEHAAPLPSSTVAETYHPEMCELVRATTGARKVFVLATALRQGKVAPDKQSTSDSRHTKWRGKAGVSVAIPSGIVPGMAAVAPSEYTQHRLATQADVALAAPVRVPHLDFTPLGARQTIRRMRRDIHKEATMSGVIAAEDAICAAHEVDPLSDEADGVIAELYNSGGKLGPRYAAYSVWRPLKRVERDPLTMAPRRKAKNEEREDRKGGVDDEITESGSSITAVAATVSSADDNIYWSYENRMPGARELGGDFLREYAMLGVSAAEPPSSPAIPTDAAADPLRWYYFSAHAPEEVLFVKLFDSAALGHDAQHAGAPWHASPEIGKAGGTAPRESIELRVPAFW